MFVETKTMRKAIADAFLTPTKHIRNVSPNPSSIRCPAISSDLIHRFAGMPPFLCFDPNQSNLQFTTLSSRLRQFHLVIDPDLSLRFLFPSSFLTLPETPQIVVVDDRVDLSFLKPFLPDTAGIHQVRFPRFLGGVSSTVSRCECSHPSFLRREIGRKSDGSRRKGRPGRSGDQSSGFFRGYQA